MKKVRQKSAKPIYAIAVIWLLWAAVMPMYTVGNFVALAVLSFVVYKLAGLIWRGKIVEVEEPEPAYTPTGNAELDELILQGKESIKQMRKLNEKIQDKKLTQQINRMEELSADIFKHVEKNPGKISQIRKFMNYYLPTTLKLLTSYAELSGQSARGKNIDASMKKIEDIMDTIVDAFEKQLDSLFGAEALDISTDITVLEGMLQREGLAAQQMKMSK